MVAKLRKKAESTKLSVIFLRNGSEFHIWFKATHYLWREVF